MTQAAVLAALRGRVIPVFTFSDSVYDALARGRVMILADAPRTRAGAAARRRPHRRLPPSRRVRHDACAPRRCAMTAPTPARQHLGMNEGVGEDGGFLVPAEFRDGIMKIVEGEDSLLSMCDNSTTARNAVTQNVDKTTPVGHRRDQRLLGRRRPGRVASKAKFEQAHTLRLNKLFARVDVTDELLEDAPQLDNYLRVKAPEVMTSVINLAIVQGNGVGKPLGIMNSGALVTVAKETSQPADTIITATW
jgi:HK97 family phage major capsid protein